MFPFGDAQPARIMPSDSSGRIRGETERRRENDGRPSQLTPHVGRLRSFLARLRRR
jgi:hypothetical protein